MKMSTRTVLIIIAVCVIAFAVAVKADDLKVRQPNRAEIGQVVSCPVMNSQFEVRKDTEVVDYKGKSYYFCCPRCIADFKEDPDKYAAAGELPLREPTSDEIGRAEMCPVSKAQFKVTSDTPVIEYRGKSFYFCCVSCVGEFRKNPDKYPK